MDAGGKLSAASLLFAAGRRPTGADIRSLAGEAGGFTISLDRSNEAGDGTCWQELVVSGLTFDLSGLAPGPAAAPPPIAHTFGIGQITDRAYESIVLRPGPHLAAGGSMFPVVRMLAWLTAQLCVLPGLEAIAWHPARCLSTPDAFRAGVSRWVGGGPFPVFSLAALSDAPDDALQSEGLALFTGQELRLEPSPARGRAASAKIAVRLLNWLVEAGPLDASQTLDGPEGERLVLEPSADGRQVRAREE